MSVQYGVRDVKGWNLARVPDSGFLVCRTDGRISQPPYGNTGARNTRKEGFL